MEKSVKILGNQQFKKACKGISERIENLSYENGDASDLGNEIGIVLGNYLFENSFGWEKDDFISGLNHGISITNGTH